MAAVARRVSIAAPALSLVLALAAAPGGETLSRSLVQYSFDDELATGPDTVAVFAKADGWVRLTPAFRFSGYRSVEIHDVAGDGRFPELQGYFALRKSGVLYVHFALMTADPFETFNLALAGPRWFRLEKDGIAFWLLSREGHLYQYSDSMPKKLIPLRPFVWYLIDLAYDIDAGKYDMTLREEGSAAPVLGLKEQINAPNQAGAAVDKFSFIGDTGEDTSGVTYYVDDVVISADRPMAQAPFVAPGRRKLFVDAWNEYEKLAGSRIVCLPAQELIDVGLTTEAAEELDRQGLLPLLEDLLEGSAADGATNPEGSGDTGRHLEAIARWNRGCAALASGRADRALRWFEEASGAVPEARVYPLSAALALARLGKFEEAQARMAALGRAWRSDPRFAVASAMIGVAAGDLDMAEASLRSPALETAETESSDAMRQRYFFVLLWKRWYQEAERFAAQVVDRLAEKGQTSSDWLERAGDACLLSGDHAAALSWYERSRKAGGSSSLLLTKLSDAHHLAGNLEKERECREAVYGSLREATGMW